MPVNKESFRSESKPVREDGVAVWHHDDVLPGRTNRRGLERFAVDLEVTLASEHNFYMGLTENLSEAGLFIATHMLKPIGTVVEMCFKLPDDETPLRVRGEVRWVRAYCEASEVPPGMGMRFVDLETTQAARVRKFLKTRAPIFYED